MRVFSSTSPSGEGLLATTLRSNPARSSRPPASVPYRADASDERAAPLAATEGRARAVQYRGTMNHEERVLRYFLVDGRLRGIPAKHGKRLVVLRYIATLFEPGIRYPEKDVNVTLRAFHPDFAALRRYLVDECLLSRENGVYWRSGGPFAV
jgi:hypothetical protein